MECQGFPYYITFAGVSTLSNLLGPVLGLGILLGIKMRLSQLEEDIADGVQGSPYYLTFAGVSILTNLLGPVLGLRVLLGIKMRLGQLQEDIADGVLPQRVQRLRGLAEGELAEAGVALSHTAAQLAEQPRARGRHIGLRGTSKLY